MVTKVKRLTILIICLILRLNAICENNVLPEMSRVDDVHKYIEESPLYSYWQLEELPMNTFSHTPIAVGVNEHRIVLLCIEGTYSQIHKLRDDDSCLSELQLEKFSLRYLHTSPVYFFHCKTQETYFINAKSILMKNVNNVMYCRNNLENQLRVDCPIIQINNYGATCQPGRTVLKKIFDGETTTILQDHTIIIENPITATPIIKYKLPNKFVNYRLELTANINGILVLEEIKDQMNNSKNMNGLDPNQTQANKIGCYYKNILLFNLKQNSITQIKPLLNNEKALFSQIALINNRWVWWEYYPSTHKENGIWVLRAQEIDGKTNIVSAIRNANQHYYQWNGKNWIAINVNDPSIPIVKIVSDNNNGITGINGKIYLFKINQ